MGLGAAREHATGMMTAGDLLEGTGLTGTRPTPPARLPLPPHLEILRKRTNPSADAPRRAAPTRILYIFAGPARPADRASAVMMTETLWKRRGDIAPPKPTLMSKRKWGTPAVSNQM